MISTFFGAVLGGEIRRKAFFLFFLLLGISIGLLPSLYDVWGLRTVLMVVGALFDDAIN